MEVRTAPGRPARRAAGVGGFLLCLAVFSTQTCSQVIHAQQPADVTGPWQGQIAVAGVTLDIRVVLKEESGGLSGAIDIPQQGAAGVPLRNVTREGDRVRFDLPAGPGLAVFDGRLADGRIGGPARRRRQPARSPFRAAQPRMRSRPRRPGLRLRTARPTCGSRAARPRSRAR